MKFGKKLLGIACATAASATLVFGGVSMQTASAASMGTVTYLGNGMGDQWITDTDGSNKAVYCMNEGRAYSTNANAYSTQRTKYVWNAALDEGNAHGNTGLGNAMALALIANRYDSNGTRSDYPGAHEFTPDDVVSSSACADLLAKILYYGYPNDKGGNGYSQSDTQDAVYWAIYSGKDNTEYGNDLVNTALAGEAPSDYSLYVYVIIPDEMTNVTFSETNQMLVNAEFAEEETTTTTEEETTTTTEEETTTTTEEETTTTTEEETTTTTTEEESSSDDTTEGTLKTTVSVDGNSSSSSRSVEIEAGTVDVVDTIDYTDLTGGATYTVSGSLVCVDDESVVAQASEEKTADDSGSGSWEITFSSVTLEEGKSYVVYESAVNKDNDNDKAEHKDISDKAQTVIVKEETQTTTSEEETTTSEEETTTSEEETTTTTTNKGELATTVDAAGKKGSAEKGAQITFDETNSIESIDDTISYTNLVAGATYTVTGTLVEVDAYGKIVNPSVATNTLELVADAADGVWTMTFDVSNVDLNAYSKYVVFESAYTAGGEDENATQDNPITHKNVKDMAQSIYTEDEEGKIRPDIEEGQTTTSTKNTNSDEKLSDDKTNGGSNSNKKGSNGPSTGDSSNTALYVTAAAAAAGIAITTIALGKKKRGSRR